MKKSLSIVLVLLLLLTACQAIPDDDQSLASTPSSSGSITPPPSSSVVPPISSAAPTAPTTQPTVPPTTQPTVPPTLPPALPPSDISDGYITKSAVYLYWVVKGTQERILICDQVVTYADNDTHIFFVKESEPTKVYVTAIGDFEDQYLFYESTYGTVNRVDIVSRLEGYLQFVADEKKFIVLDMTTGEIILSMEQYYIEYAYLDTIPHQEEIEFREWMWFSGKPTEDAPNGQYFYYWKTGEVEKDEYL